MLILLLLQSFKLFVQLMLPGVQHFEELLLEVRVLSLQGFSFKILLVESHLALGAVRLYDFLLVLPKLLLCPNHQTNRVENMVALSLPHFIL